MNEEAARMRSGSVSFSSPVGSIARIITRRLTMRRPQMKLGEVAAEVEAAGASLFGVAKAWKLGAVIGGGDLLHKRYRLVRKKGFRGFTLTWLGLNIHTGQDVAVHAVDLQEQGGRLASTPVREALNQAGGRRELLRSLLINLGFVAQLDSPYVAGLQNVFIRGGTLYYVSNCIVSLEDHLANETLYVGDLKTLAYCTLRALDHLHQRGLVHGSVCTEDMFLHTTGFSDSLWRFKLAASGASMSQYRPDLVQLGLGRGDHDSVSPRPAAPKSVPDPALDIVELGRCLRDLSDRGKVRFAAKFGGNNAEAAKAARSELESFVTRLIGELPEGQEEGSPPPVPSAADALNDPYLDGVESNLPTEGQFTELAPMVHSSGLFDEDQLSEGMSPRKTGSYSPLPSCVSPHTSGRLSQQGGGSPLATPTPMRSLLGAEDEDGDGEGGADGAGSEDSEGVKGEEQVQLAGRQTPPPNALPPIKSGA